MGNRSGGRNAKGANGLPLLVANPDGLLVIEDAVRASIDGGEMFSFVRVARFRHGLFGGKVPALVGLMPRGEFLTFGRRLVPNTC